jgi:hypothetical protein
MKMMKTLSLGLLASLVAFNVNAAPAKKATKAKTTQTQAKKSTVKKAATTAAAAGAGALAAKAATAASPELQQFNSAVGLRFYGYRLAKDKNGNDMASFSYTVENKGKTDIQSIQWASIFSAAGKEVWKQDAPLSFKQGLKAGSSVNLAFSVPLKSLSVEAQQAFTGKSGNINVRFQAKNVTFIDGKSIVVEK